MILGNSASVANSAAHTAPGLQGIGMAFVIDALSFVASLTCLALMRILDARGQQAEKQQNQNRRPPAEDGGRSVGKKSD